MSSNDFDGPHRPAGGRGAGRGSGGARGAARNAVGNPGGYAPPEGWGDDGFWRDSAVDAHYETGANQALSTRDAGPVPGGGRIPGRVRPGQPPQPGYPGGGPQAGYGPPDAGGASGRHSVPRRNSAPGPGRTGGPGRHSAPGAGRADATSADLTSVGVGRHGAGPATRVERAAAAGSTAVGSTAVGRTGVERTAAAPGARRSSNAGPGGRPPGGPGGRRPGGGGPGGGGPRRPGYGSQHGRARAKGSWWRHWTLKKALLVACCSFLGMFLIVVLAGFVMYQETSIPSQSLATAMDQNSTVYFNDGKTVAGTFGSVHRQLLTYNQIPKVVDDAVMSAEDRGFMTEGAIDPQGMLRAAWDDVTSSGGSLSGGSTITQQFVRNYYDDIGTQQTATRKIKEIFVAMKVAKEKSKQWILTNYLNTIYLGSDAYGVAAASQTYFGVPVSKLTVAQAAVIAAIIQQPSLYPEPQYRPQLENRWHYVLSGMVKMGDLTAQQAATMKFPSMKPSGSQYTGNQPWDAYIMGEVKNELVDVDHISEHQLDTGGMKIQLTISNHAERELYQAVNDNIAAIRASGYTLPSYAMIGAEAENPSNGEITAVYPGPGTNAPASQCHGTCALNSTLQGEQVGSSFKPYVLSAAVQQGMNVQTSILNANPTLWVPPFGVSPTSSSKTKMPSPYYQVSNDNHESIPGAMSNGGSTVQNALAQSSNTAFTDLAHRVGLQPIEQMAESMGGVDPGTFPSGGEGVGIALGINSLTINNQASMVATIANGGVYHQAHMVAGITEAGGTVLHPQVATHVALTPGQDSQVQYAMLKTVIDGTAPAANMTDGRPIIGKTGTTTGSKSAFFVGGIPQDVLAVGIYTKDQGSNAETLTALGGGGFGGSWPASIWHSYAESMWAALPVQNFLSPQFTGVPWLQLPKPPPPKPKAKPTPTPTKPGKGQPGGLFGTPTPTPTDPGVQCGLFGCTDPTAQGPGGNPNGGGGPNGGTTGGTNTQPSGQPTSG